MATKPKRAFAAHRTLFHLQPARPFDRSYFFLHSTGRVSLHLSRASETGGQCLKEVKKVGSNIISNSVISHFRRQLSSISTLKEADRGEGWSDDPGLLTRRLLAMRCDKLAVDKDERRSACGLSFKYPNHTRFSQGLDSGVAVTRPRRLKGSGQITL
jgi:hypothetical protein